MSGKVLSSLSASKQQCASPELAAAIFAQPHLGARHDYPLMESTISVVECAPAQQRCHSSLARIQVPAADGGVWHRCEYQNGVEVAPPPPLETSAAQCRVFSKALKISCDGVGCVLPLGQCILKRTAHYGKFHGRFTMDFALVWAMCRHVMAFYDASTLKLATTYLVTCWVYCTETPPKDVGRAGGVKMWYLGTSNAVPAGHDASTYIESNKATEAGQWQVGWGSTSTVSLSLPAPSPPHIL